MNENTRLMPDDGLCWCCGQTKEDCVCNEPPEEFNPDYCPSCGEHKGPGPCRYCGAGYDI